MLILVIFCTILVVFLYIGARLLWFEFEIIRILVQILVITPDVLLCDFLFFFEPILVVLLKFEHRSFK